MKYTPIFIDLELIWRPDTNHHIVGLYPHHHPLEPLVLLAHRQVVVDTEHKVLHAMNHPVNGLDLVHVAHVLLDGRQEEAVLGQALHGSHHNVREPQPVAHLLRLAPRQIGREQGIVLVQFLAVELAGALLRTVDLHTKKKSVFSWEIEGMYIVYGVHLIGCKDGGEGYEALLEEGASERLMGHHTVSHHGIEPQSPELDVGFTNGSDIGEQTRLVHIDK